MSSLIDDLPPVNFDLSGARYLTQSSGPYGLGGAFGHALELPEAQQMARYMRYVAKFSFLPPTTTQEQSQIDSFFMAPAFLVDAFQQSDLSEPIASRTVRRPGASREVPYALAAAAMDKKLDVIDRFGQQSQSLHPEVEELAEAVEQFFGDINEDTCAGHCAVAGMYFALSRLDDAWAINRYRIIEAAFNEEASEVECELANFIASLEDK